MYFRFFYASLSNYASIFNFIARKTTVSGRGGNKLWSAIVSTLKKEHLIVEMVKMGHISSFKIFKIAAPVYRTTN